MDNRKDMQEELLEKYKNLYGLNSKNHIREQVGYFTTIAREFKEVKDINNLYNTTLQLDSLSQKIRSVFSVNDDLYLYA